LRKMAEKSLFVAALTAIAALPIASLGDPDRRDTAWRREHPTGTRWPRFWAQGWIGPDCDPSWRGERAKAAERKRSQNANRK
jgi:hypothetical protein